MKSKIKSSILYFLYLSIILYLTSCATTEQITIPKEINISSAELSNKIPLRAGLYFNQDFRNAKYPMHIRQYLFGTASTGDALCNSSEKIMRNIFQEILIVDPLEKTSAPATKKYDVIIAPEVVKLDYELESAPFKYWCIVQTVIKWNIASPEGKEIYVSTIKSDEVKIYKPDNREVCIKQSLENNFQKAQEDIYTNSWWKNQWWRNNK